MYPTDPLERLRSLPRIPLAHGPTPLVRAPRLEAHLGPGSPQIWVKLEAWTGFGLGGNKVRKLETELGRHEETGFTHLITSGGAQSNHCRVTAAVAARLGVACTLVVNGEDEDPPRGNALLHRLFGAEIRTVSSREERAPTVEAVAAETTARGGRPRVIALGASTPRGALGYARVAVELREQLDRMAGSGGRTAVVVSASSGGTLAGLLLGATLLDWPVAFIGVSPDDPASTVRETVLELAREGGSILGNPAPVDSTWLEITDRFVGAGYGVPSDAGRDALDRLARLEGLVLDPTYTAKAAAGMLAGVRSGRFDAFDRVVFVHTGGAPALLA